jgi:hypothetical protein
MVPALHEFASVAAARTGLSDFGSATYLEGLGRLIDGLEGEAQLNETGRASAPETLLRYLINRLQVVEWHQRHPEIATGEIREPVFMIGMGRTGTTILFDLLAQDPANRVPRTWEVDRPCPPPEAATYDTDPRIAEVQAGIELIDAFQPGFFAMHPMGATLGQECISMTACEFASLIFLSQYRLPAYQQWLTTDADLGPAYRWHRQFLQLLQWRHRGQRWVLKSGAHLWALPALAEEYPDAWYIQTHRDPLRVVASLSSLFAAVRRASSDAVTVAGVAADWVEPIFDALDRSVRARQDGTIPAERVIDVQYAAFMADPMGTIERIYDHLGVTLTPAAAAAMRGYLADNPADKHGVHGYSLADTGLDAAALRARGRSYEEYFAVEREPLR